MVFCSMDLYDSMTTVLQNGGKIMWMLWIPAQVDKTTLWDKIHSAKRMPKWRNWQTRYVQGVVSLRSWGFKSLLRHYIPAAKRVFYFKFSYDDIDRYDLFVSTRGILTTAKSHASQSNDFQDLETFGPSLMPWVGRNPWQTRVDFLLHLSPFICDNLHMTI